MIKKTTLACTVAAAILFSGCGGSNSNDNETNTIDLSNLPDVSENVQELTSSFMMKDLSDSFDNYSMTSAMSSMSMKQDRSTTDVAYCSNGGLMTIYNDLDMAAISEGSFDASNFVVNIDVVFEDCVYDGVTQNGTIRSKTTTSNGTGSILLTFVTDMIVEIPSDTLTIAKNSTILTQFIDDTSMYSTENITITSNENSYQSIDLKSKETFTSDDTISYYNISGKEILDGETYIVDSTYDGSTTPLVIDDEGNIQKGGKTRYTNEQGHIITLEVIEENRVLFTVDTDGDGTPDQATELSY